MAIINGTQDNDNGITKPKLIGTNSDDQIDGREGNDWLEGRDGIDYLYGQKGNDLLFGGLGSDRLYGGDGNDTLHGDEGADFMYGGAGDDRYYVDNAADVVNDQAGVFDTVFASVSYTLGEGIEALITDASSGIGNALNNEIFGGSASNTLSGMNGHDHLWGNSGNDTLLGGAGNDVLVGANASSAGAGEIDTLTGGSGRDTFVLGGFFPVGGGDVDLRVWLYKDSDPYSAGMSDYALITDFAAGDKIQLAGNQSQYQLGNTTINGVSGTGIYLKDNTNELVGVVQNVSANTLNLNSSAFQFV